MSATTVVNIRHSKYDVFIGRPGKWGNPFVIGRDGTREECIAKYKEWILGPGIYLLNDMDSLIGKRLGCYCKPLSCHGDVLVEICESVRGR